MKILVSNDDGFLSQGIRILASELRQIADVRVVAPVANQSGVSNSLTLTRPLTVTKHEDWIYSVNGTPTDCVHLAITGIFKEMNWMPDMVISGINQGENLSDDVLYSGTVAAATEGRFLGLPAIAVSLVGQKLQHYSTAAWIVREIVDKLTDNPPPKDLVLNINVPDLPRSQIRGTKVTRLGTRHAAQPTIKATDPRGNTVYWVGLAGDVQDAGPGTDFHAIAENFISITPLRFDLTHYAVLDTVDDWIKKINI